jgi:putative ABC transport system permease protein
MPEWKTEIRLLLANLHLAPAREATIVEELAQYLEDCYTELLASGATEAEAYQRTLAELSGSELLARELRRAERQVPQEPIVRGTNRRTNMLADLWQDLRYGARMLTKQPGFTLIAVLTLAMGIGVNTAIFSVVNGVLFKPLPYDEPEGLVGVWEAPDGTPRNPVNPRNYADWRTQNQVFEQTAAISAGSVNLTEGGEPERLLAAYVTASFFPTLRVRAGQGRVFLPDEDQASKQHAVVLSHRLWQRRFGADPNVIGQTLALDGERYTVIGVMPVGFDLPRRAEMWLPLIFTDEMLSHTNRGSHYLTTIARLKPGVTVEQASAEMKTIYGRIKQQYPAQLAKWSANVFPLLDDTVGEVRESLFILFGAVLFVLLIACANVANLLLARASAREREIAIRSALGAGRWRVIRQLLTESLLLASLGGGLGALLGWWGVSSMAGLNLEEIPRLAEAGMDRHALGFTMLVSLLSGIIFGLTPALHATRVNLSQSMKEAGARSGSGGRPQRARRVFVVSQIALSLMLLAGAGLMIRSLIKLGRVDPGFKTANVLTMNVALPEPRYSNHAPRITFYRQTLENVRTMPGVQAAAFISDPPVTGTLGLWLNSFDIEGRSTPAPGRDSAAYLRWITPDYFRTLNIPLLKGRALTEADTTDRPWVVVIDEAMARRYFPNEDPLGKRLVIYWGERRPREIVGVVGNVRQTALDQEAGAHIYVPYFQTPLRYASLLVRTTAEPLSLAHAVKDAVLAADRDQPVYGIRTMDKIVAESAASRRLNMLLLSFFACVALTLAALGIYGVMSYSVGQRTQEIGLRLALGAQRSDVLRLVLRQGMAFTLVGVGIGLCGAVVLTRWLKKLLFGVSAIDPLTFIAVALLLAGVALIACYIPARRATKVDPLTSLRCE